MSDDGSSSGGSNPNSNPPPTGGAPRDRGFNALVHHVTTHKIDTALWLTRVLTMVFSLNYLLPVMGNPYQAYYKALMANAATSALRLHQRMPRVTFSREFAAALVLEDSAHYLLFSLIFLFSQPITVALMPVALFALLHAASYSLILLDSLGQSSWWGMRMLVSFVELQSRNLLRMVAFAEIFILPLVVAFIFTGRTALLTPFLYYRFLGLRYSSRRNPYTRTLFHELRLALEDAASSPRMPAGARNLIYSSIGFVSRMAPMQGYNQQ